MGPNLGMAAGHVEGGHAARSRQIRSIGPWRGACSFRTCSPAMNRERPGHWADRRISILAVECSVLDVPLPTEHRTFNLQRSTSNGNGAPGGPAFPEAGSWEAPCSLRTCSPAMNLVGRGVPAEPARALRKDGQAPAHRGRFALPAPSVRSAHGKPLVPSGPAHPFTG